MVIKITGRFGSGIGVYITTCSVLETFMNKNKGLELSINDPFSDYNSLSIRRVKSEKCYGFLVSCIILSNL